jgi:very-short-patch-repair endonuclease
LRLDARLLIDFPRAVPNYPHPLQGETAVAERRQGEGGVIKRHTETRTRAKALRKTLTPAEHRLWRILRGNRIGVKFQKQVVLAPYIADFAARSERLVIELDGDTHGERAAYDAARTAALAKRGYRVIRFTNADVMTNLDEVVKAILRELGKDPTSPLSFAAFGGSSSPPKGVEEN